MSSHRTVEEARPEPRRAHGLVYEFWGIVVVAVVAIEVCLAMYSSANRHHPATTLAVIVLALLIPGVLVAGFAHAGAITPPGKPLAERSVLGATLASYWRWVAGGVVVAFSAMVGASVANPTPQALHDLEVLPVELGALGLTIFLTGVALRLHLAGAENRTVARTRLHAGEDRKPNGLGRQIWASLVGAVLDATSSRVGTGISTWFLYMGLALLVCTPVAMVAM